MRPESQGMLSSKDRARLVLGLQSFLSAPLQVHHTQEQGDSIRPDPCGPPALTKSEQHYRLVSRLNSFTHVKLERSSRSIVRDGLLPGGEVAQNTDRTTQVNGSCNLSMRSTATVAAAPLRKPLNPSAHHHIAVTSELHVVRGA